MPIKLFYTEKGDGTPLVMLHGNGENGGFFKNQINFFAEKYRVIVPDTRGHGKSPRGTASFTFDTFADDLKELLDSLNIKRAVILGFSDGGNTALVFTLKYPEYVEKLILNSPNLYPAGLNGLFLLITRLSYGVFSLLSHFNKKAVRKKELSALMAKQPDINPKELSAIKCPTLVIAGTPDLIKKKHTRLIADSIGGASLLFIKGGHAAAATNSAEFNRKVMSFLETE